MTKNLTYLGFSSSDTLLGVLNFSMDAIIIYEPVREEGIVTDLKVVIMNDAASQMCRLSRDLCIGMDYQTLWAMDKEGFVWMKFLDVLYTDIPQRYEWEVYEGGQTKWYDVGIQTFDGCVAATYHDITERKRNLIAEQAQRRFYGDMIDKGLSRRTLLRPVRNAAGEIEDFRYDYVNYGAGVNDNYRDLASLPDVKQGALVTDLFPSIRENEMWQFMVKLANDGIMSQMLGRYNKEGLNVEGEITGQRLEDGRILLETTSLSQTEQLIARLQSKKDDLDAVLESTPAGISIFIAVRGNAGEVQDFKLTRCNVLAARLSKLPTDQYVPGMIYSAAMQHRHRRDLSKLIEAFLNGRVIEEEVYQPDIRKWLSVRIMPYKDGLLTIMQDITEVREARLEKEVLAAA